MTEAAPRSFDVYRFAGDNPTRAAQLLGWRATTRIEQGFAALAAAFRAELGKAAEQACRSSKNCDSATSRT